MSAPRHAARWIAGSWLCLAWACGISGSDYGSAPDVALPSAANDAAVGGGGAVAARDDALLEDMVDAALAAPSANPAEQDTGAPALASDAASQPDSRAPEELEPVDAATPDAGSSATDAGSIADAGPSVAPAASDANSPVHDAGNDMPIPLDSAVPQQPTPTACTERPCLCEQLCQKAALAACSADPALGLCISECTTRPAKCADADLVVLACAARQPQANYRCDRDFNEHTILGCDTQSQALVQCVIH